MEAPERFALPLLWGFASATLACSSSPSAPAPRIFTGTVDGSDAQVAMVASSHHVRIYFCGGPSSYPALTHWFTLDLDSAGGTHATASTTGDWSLDGQIGVAGASGTVTVTDGTMYAFHATTVAAATIAGLYETTAPCGKVGLIVTQASNQSTAAGQGACIGGGGAPSVEQVNPIAPLTRASDGSIQVVVSGTVDAVLVRPAAAPAD